MDRDQAKRIVEQWKRAGPALEKVREQDIREADTVAGIPVFDDVFEDAIARFPPGPDSGMVQMQAYFMRARVRSKDEARGAAG